MPKRKQQQDEYVDGAPHTDASHTKARTKQAAKLKKKSAARAEAAAVSGAAGITLPREGPRRVLADFNSLDRLVESLRTCKRVMVITGAGISVSCGIPDFRSENGVYDIASRLDLGLSCPEDLFDLEFFIDDPAPFFKFAKALYPGNYMPSVTHRFLKALENRKKLLRNFTQNIDGLEAQVGLTKYVACHGSFLTATCLSCKAKRKAEDIRAEVMRQEVPECPVCRKGVIKPDITFFGEKISNTVKRAVESDYKKADLLLVLGTSLQVAPVSRILQFLPSSVPQVLVNRDLIRPPKATSDGFDLNLLGNCDDIIQHLCTRLGWELPEPVTRTPPPPPRSSGVPKTSPSSHTDGVEHDQRDEKVGELVKSEGNSRSRAGKDEGGEGGDKGIIPDFSPSAFVPPNTFLFRSPGAFEGVEGLPGSVSTQGGDEEDDFTEVVTCDGCNETIEGDVFACKQCFGFDLCGRCHSGGQSKHSKTTGHTFRRET